MKPNPVPSLRLLIAILVPVLALFTFTFLLVNLADAQSTLAIRASKPQFSRESVSYEFTKQDSLLVDADGNGMANPGDIIQYALTFSNTGETAVSNLQITDTVDPNSTFLGNSLIVSPIAFADAHSATINTILEVSAPGLLDNDDWQGSQTTISTYDATTVQGGLVVVNHNGSFIYTPPNNFIGDDSFSYTLANVAGNDTTIVKITVINSDLAITKSIQNATPFEGDRITYTVAVSNQGDLLLTNVIVSDTLPAGVTYVDYSADISAPYNPATGVWNIPNLGVNVTYFLTIFADVDTGTVGQTITNTAVFDSMDQVDSNPNNNEQSVTLTVQPLVDIATSKTVNDNTPIAESTIVYTISASNLGFNDATGVQLTDVLPDGVTFVSADQPSFTPPLWSIGDLNASQTVTLNMTATVNSMGAGNIYTNTATVTAVNETDSNPHNDSDQASITVHLAPTAIDDTPTSSSPIIYALSSGNTLNTAQTTDATVLHNDSLGYPTAAVIAYGYPNGDEMCVNCGTTATENGGSVTVSAHGDFIYTPAAAFIGSDTFFYTIQNSEGSSVAKVEIDVRMGPVAIDDPNGELPTNSTPPSGNNPHPHHFATNSSNNTLTGSNHLLQNDTLANPVATLISFGDGDLGGTVTSNLAGTSATADGHQLTVDASGVVTYTPAHNFAGEFSFNYRIENSVGFDDATVTFAVGTRPICQDNPTYTATGNMEMGHNTTTGVLANDSGQGIMVTAVQGNTVGVPQNTNKTGLGGVSGSVTMHSGGNFNYNPPPGFTGNDSFSYTIDNAFNAPTTCDVTISVSNMVWFIDNSRGGNNWGTLQNPFTSINAFNNVNHGGTYQPQNNHLIYLMQGNGFAESGFQLRNGQDLIGQAVNLNTVITPNANSRDLPIPSGLAHTPLITTPSGNGINLASGNTVRGLNIGNTTTGYALSGSVVGNLTVNDVEISGTGGAIQITSSGNFGNNVVFDSLSSSNSVGSAINLVNVSGTMLVNNGGSGIETTGAGFAPIDINGGALNLTYPGNITQANNDPTINIHNGHSGIVTFNSGTINASNGTGLQFDNADGIYNFNGTTTLNGGDAGIDITNGSDGTFTFNNTSIIDPSGTSFYIQTSNATVTYSGSIDDADDTAVYIWNNDNSTVTFQSGSITSPDGGITVRDTNNSTINFNGDIDLDTGSDDALVLSNNDNSTINFRGNMIITTTTQEGFRAVGGGTINVTSNSAVINTTNGGTAVQIEDTTIGSNNITFQSISTDGATNGILLNNTGASGALIVNNGTIQNSTGDGVYIENGNISLNQMSILNSGNHGIAVQLSGSANMQVELNNNTISNSDAEGILANAGNASTDDVRMDLTLDSNIVNLPDDPTVSGVNGILIQSQNQTTLCANITNNQSIGVNGATDFHLIQGVSSAFFLQNFDTDVTTTLLNESNSKTGGGIATVSTTGEPFAGAQNCSQPRPAGNRDTAVPPLNTNDTLDINHTITTLPAGKSITLQFNVQVNNPFPEGIEQISNQAFATATDITTVPSDNPHTPALNDPTITPIATIKLAYLPLIFNNHTTLPDLIVASITPTNNELTVVLKNNGTAPVTHPFWVDAYFNPNPPPTQVNQTIQTMGIEGIVWGVSDVALPLAPGETLTLTLNSPYYDADNSNFTGTIPTGNIYVQVDSANAATTYGGVLELHEVNGTSYNNISSTTVNQAIIVHLDALLTQQTKRPFVKRP